MQIGEFAKICGTKISVLRHYDKEGILIPDYIDKFSGYRYYTKDQISVFNRIKALKKAGFSLQDIKTILDSRYSDGEIFRMFDKKESELMDTINNLEEAKKIMLGVNSVVNVEFFEENGTIKAKTTKFDANETNKAIEALDSAVCENGYQRVSGFCTFGSAYGFDNSIEISCEVIKLNDSLTELYDDINIPFENDDQVVGKWKTMGEFPTKEDFFADRFCEKAVYGDSVKEIYFLPNGEILVL